MSAPVKMSPAARAMLERLTAESQKLNDQTEAETLVSKRMAAQEQLAAMGFPTRKDEDWQYTSLVPFFKHELAVKSPGLVVLDDIKPHLPPVDTIRLVFVDGVFSEELSGGFDFIPDSLSIEMAEADAIQTIRLAEQADAFEVLNEMLLNEGVTLRLDAKTALEMPVHLLFVQTADQGMTNGRLQVEVGAHSEMTLIQQYISLDAGLVNLVNDMVSVKVDDSAFFKQIVLQDLSLSSYYFNHQFFELGTQANLNTIYVGLGGEIGRHQNQADMVGEHVECRQNSVNYGQGKQVLDSRTTTGHKVPNCNSQQLHKFVLTDDARGVFNGMIEVAKDAQKTDGLMDNKNLLLSDSAKMDTKPQLEIYADDVLCSHGCASGQIDDNQIFYAQARGISKQDAMQLITKAFLLEPLEDVSNEDLQHWLQSLVSAKLA